jgi:hypothetical protein
MLRPEEGRSISVGLHDVAPERLEQTLSLVSGK